MTAVLLFALVVLFIAPAIAAIGIGVLKLVEDKPTWIALSVPYLLMCFLAGLATAAITALGLVH